MTKQIGTDPPITEEIFPQHTGKSYALVELVKGSSSMVGKGPEDTVFSFPLVLLWEFILLLGVTLGLFLFSLFKQAPLDVIANPQVTTDPAKAPWYFIGLQELLEHMHPLLAGVMIPTALVLFIIALPYIDRSRINPGRWFSTERGKSIFRWASVYTLVAMPTYILLDNRYSIRELLRESTPQWVAQGLVPAIILGLIVLVPVIFLIRMKASSAEIILYLFTVMFVSAIVLTITGFLFRGPGFKLYWPWEMPNGYNPWHDF